MKTRTLLGVAALLAATAMPTIGSAQRTHRNHGHSYNRVRTSYGYGPFYPSYVPAPSYNYLAPGRAYRSGGATFYFGGNGGYYGNYPSTYYYSAPGYGYYGTGYRQRYRSNRPYSFRRHR